MNFGTKINLNLSPLPLLFLTFRTFLGNSEAPLNCMQWQGNCDSCQIKRSWLEGIFCANFYYRLGNFQPCRKMWCGDCYISATHPNFPIVTKREENDRLENAWKPVHQNRETYLRGRNGDHTLVPFECDLYIFRKRRQSEPNLNDNVDLLLLALIRRANLDGFWSTAPGTVNKHRLRLRAGLKLSESLNLKGPYLQQCALPPYDHCGYKVAIHLLLNSLNPGRNHKNFSQWNTIRKMRTCFSNIYQSF